MLIVLFLVSHFNFLFVPCGGLSWLPVSFLLHVKYTLSHRIVMEISHARLILQKIHRMPTIKLITMKGHTSSTISTLCLMSGNVGLDWHHC